MDSEVSADVGRASRRDRIMGKLFKSSKDKKLSIEENASEISDFLGISDRSQTSNGPSRSFPSQNSQLPSLAIDTSSASRFTKTAISQQGGSFRARSHSPQRRRKHKGLNVRFADSYPEVIGEGGDECETAVAEIGRRKRAKSVPTTTSTSISRQASRSGDDEFVPPPIRRTQTGFSMISEEDTPSSKVSSPLPLDPPKPRGMSTGLLDISKPRDEDRRSFIDLQQQEQRRAEAMALTEGIRRVSGKTNPDSDDHVSSPESTQGSPHNYRQQSQSTGQKEPTASAASEKPAQPPSIAESVSAVLRAASTRTPPKPPQRNPSRRAPLPHPDSAMQPASKPPVSPLPPVPTDQRGSNFNHDSTKSPRKSLDELRTVTEYLNDSFLLQTPNSPPSVSDSSSKANSAADKSSSRAFALPSIDQMKSLSDVVTAAGDDALDVFLVRTKHLYELFRLYAEKEKPLDTAQPEDVARAAVWWFLKGRTSLENAIRNRANTPDDTRALIARYQAYTDLSKAYWLTEVALPEIAAGKYNPTSGELGEVRQALTSNLRKLSISMKRNEFLPPEDPFLPQTMDKSIWVSYPSLSQDIIALLNGMWGSALAAVQQPTRSMEALEALPIGDTPNYFLYTRVPVDVYLMEQGAESAETFFSCMLSVVRSPDESDLNFIVASQNGTVSLRIQSAKKTGPTWQSVKWRPDSCSIEIKLPRGFILSLRYNQSDFKTLWSIFEFSNKIQGYLYPRQDEVVAYTTILKGFHYFDSNPQGRSFPKDAIGQCQVTLFERVTKENSPTGPRTFHRGFRLAVVTGPRIRTLSGISHTYSPQLPIQFAMLRGEQRTPLLQLGFNDGKERGRMIMSFADEQEREKVLRLICGSYIHFDEEVVAEVPLEGINISEGLGDIKGGFAATQQLPWQRARIVNDKFTGDVPMTVLAENLRIVIDSVDKTGVGIVSTITDRVNVAPGELKLRLGTKDILTFQVLRQPQSDMTVSLLEPNVPKETTREFASLRSSIHGNSTVRTYRFPSFKDLHAFQLGLTGYNVLFDGVAASLNISRRMMVVPIHKKWEAGTTRIQIVQQEKTVQLLAFFEDWHHGQCMGFVLKGTDVFESFSRNGKAGLKLADAKFPLPKVATDDGAKPADAAFLCLDMPDFAGEHDDITILFDDALERDRLCTVLPAPVKSSRISKVK